MRQLDSCDFCGEHAEGVFEVVPGSAAGGARRLALCSDCRATLQSVVDPLLDDASADRTTASDDGPGAAESPDDEPDPRGASDTHDSVPETDAAPDADSATRADPAGGDAGQSDSPSEGVTIQAGRSEASSDERRPEGYAQVIRLLQNRDGPMPREDLRALATNAYDLRERTFEDAVAAAVENGDVEETNGGLRTA